MRKGLFILLALGLFSILVNAQDFDRKLEQMAIDLAKKVDEKKKDKVAVWGFFTEEGGEHPFGNFLTEDFSIHLANHATSFSVVERTQLRALLKEYRLSDEGYISERTAKQLGKFKGADAVVVGTYSILRTGIKTRIKVLDTETALQIAGALKTLPMTPNIARMLGKL